jgi:hypothetical protein
MMRVSLGKKLPRMKREEVAKRNPQAYHDPRTPTFR